MGYRAKLLKPGEVGEGTGDRPWDLADLEDPRSAAAAAGPADEKLAIEEVSSGFFLPPKREPRNPSFSLLFFSFSFFFEKNPPFFSFSFSFSFWLLAVDVPDSLRTIVGRVTSSGTGGTNSWPRCCCKAIPGGIADRGAGGAMPGGNSYWDGERAPGDWCVVDGEGGLAPTRSVGI